MGVSVGEIFRAGLRKLWTVLPLLTISRLTCSPPLATMVLGCHCSESVPSMLALPPLTVTAPRGLYGPGALWPTTAALGTAAPAAGLEGFAAAPALAGGLGLAALDPPPVQLLRNIKLAASTGIAAKLKLLVISFELTAHPAPIMAASLSAESPLTLTALAASALALIWLVILQIRSSRMIRRYHQLLGGVSAGNLEEIMALHVGRINEHERNLKELGMGLDALDRVLQTAIQRVGLVRFNPFEETGGDQSFAIALL